jgi:hypothetical protein
MKPIIIIILALVILAVGFGAGYAVRDLKSTKTIVITLPEDATIGNMEVRY